MPASDPAAAGPFTRAVRGLPPNIFAVVMATGIVSLAANGAGMRLVAQTLFGINVFIYALLWILFVGRCVAQPTAVREDLRSHAKAPGFFTVVAGTAVLGNQCVLLGDAPMAGLLLWLLALALWVGLTYTVLPGLMEVEPKPPLEKGINGAWLLAVVATQAVCVLGALVAPHVPDGAVRPLLFTALAFWLVGGMLYIWLIALIFYRVLFLPLAAGDLTPPYWINMGAMAISTLAGVSLLRGGDRLPLLAEISPFVKGLTLLFWATATWWIPLLLALGAWRHLRQRYPLAYDHGYWAAVFPLGMYTVCTQNLLRELNLPFLAIFPAVFVWLALGAWVLTIAGLLLHLARAGRP
jgi:tellurite resistance protein TehA-like permease